MNGAAGVRVCKLGGLLAVMLVVMNTAAAWGLNTKETRETLRGLPGVQVVVENLSPDLERAGMTGSQLQTDAELRLRKAGIRVLTPEERLASLGGPYLYISVTGGRAESMTGHPLGYAAFSQVSLHQVVWLDRDPAIMVAGAETWSSRGVLDTVNPSNTRPVRESVADQVDQFINAFLAVNPGRTPVQAAPPAPAGATRKDKRR